MRKNDEVNSDNKDADPSTPKQSFDRLRMTIGDLINMKIKEIFINQNRRGEIMRVLNYLFLFTFIIIPLLKMELYAQPSTANYAFTHAANGSLTDMSAGTTEIIGPNSPTGILSTHSEVQSIGFNFVFMSKLYTEFGVSSRGTFKFGAKSSGSIASNNLNTTSSGLLPLIAPFWDALGTSSTGKVHYKTTGAAPNRVLVIEWQNMRIAVTGSTGADGTFQLRLYETTGKIEFVYGSMNIGTGSPVVTASIGFTTGNDNNNLLSVTNISTPAVTTLSASVVNNLVNSNTPGPIAGLNSSNEGERVIYTFTPPAGIPNAPANLTFTNIGDNSLTLNWTDNATNESGYYVENVNDGIVYSILPANTTSFAASNLSLQTNYTFRVYAVTEGAISPALEGSQATTNVSNLLTTASYVFTHNTNGSLTDMSTGTYQLIGADNTFENSVFVRDIGFNFIFMGNVYSNFGVTVTGVLRLGGVPPSNFVTNNLNTTTATALPLITPFWDAVGTSSSGAVRYKVTGSAPSRVLTVEWFNMSIATGSTTADGTFQLRLYETSGKIEFVYGEMNIGAGSPFVTASIGFTTDNASDKLASIKNISSPTVSYVPAGVNNLLVNSNVTGPIPGLHSSNNGERVIYTFTPPSEVPAAPANLTFTNAADNSMTLNWTDNASNERGYLVENVNDGILTNLPANSTSYNAAGLSTGTNYNWRVYALIEGSASSALEGMQTTANVNNVLTAGSYLFTHAANGTLTDMSTGATEVIGPDADLIASSVEEIGFDFYFMGERHNKFSVTSTGILRLSAIPITVTTFFANNLNQIFDNYIPLIAPFWDQIGTSSTGGVRYKITGTAPYRVLNCEWFNMSIARPGSNTADGTYQLRLYETTGKIEFIYGSMNIGEGSPFVTASIGFTTGNTHLLSVRNISSPVVTAVLTSRNDNLINSNTPGPIEGLNSTNNGERIIYSFIPPVPPPPTNLSITNVTAGSMTLNWTPVSGIISQVIYISENNIDFEYFKTISSTETSYNAAGLNPSTTYYWRIYSLTEGGVSTPLEGSQITNGASFAGGTKTIGAAGNYTTLQAVFNDINAQGLTGAVLLELLADYNPASETYPLNIGSLTGSSESNTVILRPASGVTGVTFSTDALQTFNLNQTKFFTIDGRPGGTGANSEITIANANTSGNAILFINGSSNNTIKYCKVNGVNTVHANLDGVIAVSAEGGSFGNNDNTVENCEVSNGETIPINLIFVGSGLGTENNRFSVSNCRIYNFGIYGIQITGEGTGHKITGNSIYRNIVIVGVGPTGIRFHNKGKNQEISGNFIGGSDINCGGGPFVTTSGFSGIYFTGDSSLIDQNIIQNISSGGNGNFSGIQIEFTSNNNTVTNNIIGHDAIPNSISSAATVFVWGIRSSSSETLIAGNLIANITSTGTTTNTQLTAMQLGGSGGSLNSVIKNNTIHNLISNSTRTVISVESAVTGIAATSQIGSISGNTIYGLTSIPGGTGTANTSVIGIFVPGAEVSAIPLITNNRIYNLSNASTGTAPNIFGIVGSGGNGLIANNQVSIDNGGSPNPINILGININVTGSENNWSVYYNSVNIGGEDFGSLSSSAFYKQNTNTINLKNNLFYNSRTGTGGHYALAFGDNTNITSDYNLLIGSSNIALWGATPYNFADYKANSGLDGFSYSTDPATVTASNLFVDAASGNLNINASNNAAYYVDGKGIAIEGISGDFDDSTGVRNTLINEGATDIGSDEFDFTGIVPELTASGAPAPSTTTTYSFAGRELGSIMWGSGGTVPSSISAKYFSGYNPPGTLNDGYGNAYWDINATGGSGFSYDLTLNYTPAVLFNIGDESGMQMGKRDGGEWSALASTVNTTEKTLTATGLNSFSEFTLLGDAASSTFQLSVNVENGWNMVSVPGLHPTNQNVDTWWADRNPSTFVFGYNTSGYHTVTEASPGNGYWMDHIGANTYNTGDEWPAGGINIVPNTPISGDAGWNLIGGYHYNAAVSGITTTPPGLQTGFVYGYTSSGGYQVADDLIPGYGYWIELTGAGSINLPDPSFKGAGKIADRISEDFGKIIITDNAGKSYTLYAGNTKDLTAENYKLPPVPPAGMFDVRYGSGRFVEDLSSSNQSIEMQGIEYPVQVQVQGMSIKLEDETGKELSERIKDGEKVTISKNVSKLLVSKDLIPDKYSLEQNYPNPFNPATIIEFAIPEDAKNVRLTIYNALGERVAELVNGNVEAGIYKYHWDARNYASGLYIYELRTEAFNSVKKMMLLK